MQDYFDTKPYDRNWIYRAHDGDVIVDSIWAMANKRAQVDRGWLERGPEIEMFGQNFRVVPPEELIWSKLYVLQRDRCDWPDILNLISATGSYLDWNHLLGRVEHDLPLIRGLLSYSPGFLRSARRSSPHGCGRPWTSPLASPLPTPLDVRRGPTCSTLGPGSAKRWRPDRVPQKEEGFTECRLAR
jgi:hypothetical protein